MNHQNRFQYLACIPRPGMPMTLFLQTFSTAVSLVHGIKDALDRGFELYEEPNRFLYPSTSIKNFLIALKIPEESNITLPEELVDPRYRANIVSLGLLGEYLEAYQEEEVEKSADIIGNLNLKVDETTMNSGSQKIDFSSMAELEDTPENRKKIIETAASYKIELKAGNKKVKTLVNQMEKAYNSRTAKN